MHLNLGELVQTVGYLGIFAIVFAESGLFFGFFLPGDSLLFTAGILAASGQLSLIPLILIVMAGAILGDSFGYYFGLKTGAMLFSRNESRFFKKKHLEKTSAYYDRHGSKTLVMARFIPVVRTFAPILAGASRMQYRRFFFWNALGGTLWTLLLTILGYTLGTRIPNVDHYIIPVLLAVIVLSLIPVAYEAFKTNRSK